MVLRRSCWLCALVCAIVLWVPLADAAAKKTSRFKSIEFEIWVNNDGSLRVKETTYLFSSVPFGGITQTLTIPYYKMTVLKDGSPEPYLSHYMDNPFAIRVGVAPRRVKAGNHIYTIDYRTGVAVSFDGKYSSLNWNTGVLHKSLYEKVAVRFHLPICAVIEGFQLDTPSNNPYSGKAVIQEDLANTVELKSTAPLLADHGFFITIKFLNRTKCAQG